MVDVAKQVAFWREGAQEDWAVAQELVAGKRARHGLFFAHLALEKILEAHVCRQTQDLAPRNHNLVRLAVLAEINLRPEQIDVLAEMNAFIVDGRYPESLTPLPTLKEAQAYMGCAEGVFQRLMNLS